MEVGDRDLYNPNVMRDGMHDWVLANENMARVLAAKSYHYQFVFAQNAGHVDHAVKQADPARGIGISLAGLPLSFRAFRVLLHLEVVLALTAHGFGDIGHALGLEAATPGDDAISQRRA